MRSHIESLLRDIPEPDASAADAVRRRAARVLRPSGALARMDEIAAWLAAWQRTDAPAVRSPEVLVFAGDHGVTDEDVGPYPPELTASMAKAAREGVATVSVMAREVGAALRVIDVGVGVPTGNIARGPAMTPGRFMEAFEAGRGSIGGADLLVLGEIGIGNTTAAAAVATALFGGPAGRWTGPGTGATGERFDRKVAAVEAAARRNAGAEPIEVLRDAGGAELAAICGAALEARRRSIPVILDGFVVTASVAPLELLRPGALDHCLAGHRSPEPGHGLLLERLGQRPILELEMRLGEGSGALAAVPLVRLAAACVRDVATFEEWV